ncbi:hypothetical protein A5844_002259 [Enterococcus sp. 10A9_DIV0425]|uniref:Flagellar motor switch protein n=1 Tax=Candidatus Enterococcus wittei TaxID=1987383 RepID=A0A242JX23_9ENTE|nr:flagellar motor switch protein [Enterococcus sp. 10A9_DIV0425]OTP09481.1 hypothetical protein A5844_002259 [Enterococcus sp. 10A9_DIV0425]THE09327.1 flagellar motor switch protein [Enterococcus hirae]
METEVEKKKRFKRKKEEMKRLCQMLDIDNWESNEHIVQEIRAIIHTERQPKDKKVEGAKKIKKAMS